MTLPVYVNFVAVMEIKMAEIFFTGVFIVLGLCALLFSLVCFMGAFMVLTGKGL
jgi:hypothetical protein